MIYNGILYTDNILQFILSASPFRVESFQLDDMHTHIISIAGNNEVFKIDVILSLIS